MNRDERFEAWVAEGIAAGWCTEPYCDQHDGPRLTPEEAARFDDDGDPCVAVVRLLRSGLGDWLAAPGGGQLEADRMAEALASDERVAHTSPSEAERTAQLGEYPTARSRLEVLSIIAGQHPAPVTPKEVGYLGGTDRDRAHPRMRELHRGGWIEPTGDTRDGTEHNGDLWRLTGKALAHPDVPSVVSPGGTLF